MNIHSAILFGAVVLFVCPALGQSSLPVLMNQINGPIQEMRWYLKKYEEHLTYDLDADELKNFTISLDKVKPDIVKLPQSSCDYLSNVTNRIALWYLGQNITEINARFPRIIELLWSSAKLTDAKFQSKMWTSDQDVIIGRGRQFNIEPLRELEILDKVLQRWNDMLVNVTIPFQQILNRWSDSSFLEPYSYDHHIVRLYLIRSFELSFPTICEVVTRGNDLSLSSQMKLKLEDDALAVTNSIRAIADEILNDCRGDMCSSYSIFAVGLKKNANCGWTFKDVVIDVKHWYTESIRSLNGFRASTRQRKFV